MSAAVPRGCFHCGEPLFNSTFVVCVEGREERVCCAGCLAVADLIARGGFGDYYRYRDTPAARPDVASVAADAWTAYADAEVARQFVERRESVDTVALIVDGLRCSACSWLVQRALQALRGVVQVDVNAATGRAYVEWEHARVTLADVMRVVARLGYRPHPLTGASAAQTQQQERRSALKRLLVASFGMMQVMMFAASVYSAELNGDVMDAGVLEFFRYVSLLVATPVMLYAGAPFLLSAWNSLRACTIGMDAPVSAALVLAYAASVWNVFAERGEVYFDSVTMFIFFLTLGRFVTMSVRHRTTGVADALARQLPAIAHRIEDVGAVDVPAAKLHRGDVLLVRPGEVAPADGELMDAAAHIDESLLTGESLPVRRQAGERIAAGALNVGAPLRMRATAIGAATTLSHIAALLQRAQAQKPASACAADRAAARFLACVLAGAAVTCGAWLALEPSRAFEATLAVLVVACPCAFAIAMPAAVSAAIAQLAQRGLLVTRPDALQKLAAVDTFVFDKTGTLTRGEVRLERTTALRQTPPAECLALAAALEESSEHPLARAFAPHRGDHAVGSSRSIAGLGVEGVIDGRRYRIGAAEFVAELRGASWSAPAPTQVGTLVFLGDENAELACFELRDDVRESAAPAVGALRELGVKSRILSGDQQAAVADIGRRCAIEEQYAGCSPEQKLAHVQALQRAGARAAMVGDGVNDAPVLGAAAVSIAMGRAAALAQAGADMVLVSDDLQALPEAISLARRTLRIARQNLAWSAAYNFGSLPLAALGYIPPWVAALGMSLSSIAVVLNAMRLLPTRFANADRRPEAGGRRLEQEKIEPRRRALAVLPPASGARPPAELSVR
jgi:P-type Cu2+ transporter